MNINQISDCAGDAIKKPQTYNGFLGVSIRNRFFSHKTMESYILWGSKQFRQFFILLMDDPDLYNYVIFSSNSYNTARAKARQMGYEKKVGYQRIAAKYNCTNITVLTFSDFIYKKEYQSTLSACRDYLAIDKAYQDDLISMMHKGIGGKIEEYFDQNRFSEKEKKFTINTLFQYILEEFAAIIYVSEQIAPIEVDPYEEFSTKTQLYAGAYPDLAARIGITQRGHLFVLPTYKQSPKQSTPTFSKYTYAGI